MKITCTVEKCDRQQTKFTRRAQTSSLSIGKGSSAGDVCIFHQTPTNTVGTKYKVKDNISQVFTRFINEGKATIRFKQPPHDLAIRCDALQLKSFLNVLRMVLEGKPLSHGGGGLSTLNPSAKVKKPKTKLSILQSSEYPTLEGFPRTLVSLQIMGINKTKFDERILRLQQLQVLDLRGNKFQSIPAALGNLQQLKELILAKNELGVTSRQYSAWDWLRGSAIRTNLNLLDLSYNELAGVPSSLGDLLSLVTLKLDHNQLEVLHSSIGRMPSLRFLSASHNKLQFLPGSVIKLRLESLDVSCNTFKSDCETQARDGIRTSSLKELSAQVVIRQRLALTAADVPATVLRFMQACDFCMCGNACFNPTVSKIMLYDVRKLAYTVTNVSGESHCKPVKYIACSGHCVQKWFKT